MPNGDEPVSGAPPIQVTVTDVADHEIDPKQAAKLAELGRQEAGGSTDLVAALWAGIVDGLGLLITLMVRSWNSLMVLLAEFFDKAQGEENPEFWDLVAKITQDTTGVPVDAEALKKSFFGSGRLAGMDELGKNIFNLLAQEFVLSEAQSTPGLTTPLDGAGIGGLPTGKLTPAQGIAAARRFLGFLMSNSIREGNVSAIVKFLPQTVRFAEGFRDYGEVMARNLGLSRLARRGLSPLVEILIADPLTWALQKQYRNKLLSPGSATRAWLAGHITGQELREELAIQGWSEEKISALIQENVRDLSFQQISALRAFGLLDDATAILHLRRAGYTEEDAKLVLEAEDRIEVRKAAHQIATRALNELLEGSITVTEFDGVLTRVGLTERERAGIVGIAGELTRLPRKTLTLAQMRQAYLDGIVNLLEWEDYLIRVGYREDDRKVLTIQLLLDAKEQAEAESRKAAREQARAARLQHPPTGESSP